MHLFKPYFQLLSNKLEIKIIESFEREETEEEIKKRKEELELQEKARQEQMKKDKKKIINPPVKKPEENENTKIYEAKPSNISMAVKYPKFSKWIASLFQVVKDMVILDCNV